jgi:hypothetical protein
MTVTEQNMKPASMPKLGLLGAARVCTQGTGARSLAHRRAGVALLAAVCLALVAIPSVALAQGPEAHLLSKTFGAASSTPSDPYPLTNPTDVAVDNSTGPSSGDIYVGNPSADEQQTVKVSAESGTYTLKFAGQTTAALKYNAVPSEIQLALEALAAIGAKNVSAGEVFGGEDTATVTFVGKFVETSVEQLSCDASKLVGAGGAGASCTVATTVAAALGNDVEKLSPSGQFLLMLGQDVNKSAVEQTGREGERDICPAPGHPGDVCQQGSRGTGPGAFVGEDETEAGDQLAEPRRVRLSRLYLSVDGSGDLYVGDPGTGAQLITKFNEAGEVLSGWGVGGQLSGEFTGGINGHETFHGIAVDPMNDLFVWGPLQGTGDKDVLSFNSAGAPRTGEFESIIHEGLSGLAVDADEALYPGAAVEPSTNDRYLLKLAEGRFIEHLAFHCHGEEIEEAPCVPLEQFGVGELSQPEDVAVGPGSTVYVANTGAKNVAVFTKQPIESPTATIEAPTEASYTSAHVSGSVNPHGTETSCKFEYVTDAHFKVEGFIGKLFKSEGARREAEEQKGYEPPGYTPCESDPGSGTSAVAVQASLSGLKPATSYHVRLIARSRLGAQASSEEPNETFATEAVDAPVVSHFEVKEITASGARFVAQINPNAPEAAPTSPAVEAGFKVSWGFECTPACPNEHSVGNGFFGELKAGNSSEEVSVQAEELQPGTVYEVTLIAKNAGPEVKAGPVEFKTAKVAPQIDATLLVASSLSEATVAAQIRPGGAATTYHVQYIPEAQFATDGGQFGEGTEETTESGSLGEDDEQHEARATLTGLTAQTAYRYRFLARNEVAPVQGPAEAFFTYASLLPPPTCLNESLRNENDSLALPDCRAYERVSPEGNSAVYQPEVPGKETEGYRQGWYPMQSASNGQSATYVGEPASSGLGPGTGNSGNGEGDEQLARRSNDGWLSGDISPLSSNAQTSFEAFSPDLSRGLLRTAGVKGEAPLSAAVETKCGVLYSRSSASGSYEPLFTSEATTCRQPFYVGSSADGSAQVFESSAKKTENAQVTETPTSTASGKGHENIYDAAGGQLHLVNVLPGGKADPDASIGRLASEEEAKYGAAFGGEVVNGAGVYIPSLDTSGAVSAEGSKIFFTNLATGIIYMRENPTAEEESASAEGKCVEAGAACTVQVSAGKASYQSATPDGRFVYYIEEVQAGSEVKLERLWRFDSENGTREALSQAGSEVQGVIGVNQSGADGAYLYFVAAGKLSAEAEARKCVQPGKGTNETAEEVARETAEEAEGKAPPGRGCNLYVTHEEQTKLVAVLSPHDQQFDGYQKSQGDWRATPGSRSAELTPDGAHLVLLSTRRLTPYDNATASGESCASSGKLLPCPEVYLYDAASAQISCASCQPAGLPALDVHGFEEPSTYLPGDFGSITHMRRWISSDGNRIFFDTDQPLLPEDTNGLYDVYEWERAGSGSCSSGSALDGGGCLYLLSGDSSAGRAFFVDSDESGENAFLVTRAQLTPSDRNDKPDLYDVRVGGGFPVPPVQLVGETCSSAEACKAPPAEVPVESFPASAAFSGSGNLFSPLPAAPAPKPKTAAELRAEKLSRALRVCHKLRARRSRTSCEKQAGKRYGAKKTKGKMKRPAKRSRGERS